jgi:hypothetical protein
MSFYVSSRHMSNTYSHNTTHFPLVENQPSSFSIQHRAVLCIFIFIMSDWSLLMGFFIPIKVVFFSNGFLEQQIGTFKLTKLELFTILKSTCIQFAEVQKCFHNFNEKKTQNQNNIKSLLLDANFLFLLLNRYKLLNANRYSNL